MDETPREGPIDIKELLVMIYNDQKEIARMVQASPPGHYLDEKLDMILNVQHTILQALYELLIIAEHEGKI